jgi:4-amino-4-deoxy-L-arabinose transferase-like glycosyltransferase
MIKKNYLFTIIVVLIFFSALGIRLYDLTDVPLESHLVRQLRSLLIARSFYHGEGMGDASLIEPPIMEITSAFFYTLAGHEIPWVQRIISITFWMLGGLALFDLGKTISNKFGALISIVYYFFLPFSIITSRYMMPDPMMAACTVLAIWTLVRWEKQRTMRWAVAAGLVTGYALLVKSVAGFILLPAFALFTLQVLPIKSLLKDKQVWTIIGLTALPSLIFYIFGIFILGTLASQFQNRFFLNLLVDPAHYLRWLNVINNKLEIGIVIIALISLTLIKEKKYQYLLLGWWIGFVIYGLVFPYHIWTHDYYHMPLVPIVALSLSPLGGLVSKYLVDKEKTSKLNLALVLVSMLLYIVPNMWNTRVEFAREDFRQEGQNYQPIANALVGYQDEKIISLSGDYGLRLEYFTQLKVASWPIQGDFRLGELSDRDFNFDRTWEETLDTYHFFIVLSQNELDRQPNLAAQLENYSVFYQGGGVIIYNLQQPVKTNFAPAELNNGFVTLFLNQAAASRVS